MADADVIVIGAGAAGIAAARHLLAAGRDVTVVEADAGVGGRARTVEIAGMALDLGCGWLHSADRNPLVAIAEAHGFAIVRGDAAWRDQWRGLGFPRDEREQAFAAWNAFVGRLADPPPGDRAADALDPGGPWNAYAEALSGYINGAALERLSVADFLAYDRAASDVNWRVAEGYGGLVAALAPPGRVRAATPVRAVRDVAGGVAVDTPRGTLTARAAIVTVSTAVLAAGGIAFDPPVDDHLHAASRLPLGLADKLYIEIIGDAGLEPETHLIGDPRRAGTGSYYIRPLGRPVIESFFGGPGAAAIEREGAAAGFALAIDELAALIGSGVRRHLRPLAATAWGRMDRVRGSYSHALPGAAGCRATLARPARDRLFFAGEATHATDFSTAHGAWASGIRAADELLALAGRA